MDTFAEGLRFLRSRQLVSFGAAEDALENISNIVKVFAAFRELFPDGSCLPNLPRRLVDARGISSDGYAEIIGAVLSALFPIDENDLAEDGLQCIPIQPISPSMSWDEFDELLENPGNFLDYDDDDPLRFYIMVWTIGNGVDKETWDTLSDGLGWGVKYPRPLMKTDQAFDVDLLEKNLLAAGLAPFMAAIKIAWKDTGIALLDWDMENDFYPDFTTENIVRLAREWQEGKDLLEDLNLAAAMWQADRDVFGLVVDVMSRSLSKKPKAAKTLMEVFAQEGDDDELPEPTYA
jgi:hypothetical protein